MSGTDSLILGLAVTVVALGFAFVVIRTLLHDVGSRSDLDPQQRQWWSWLIVLGSGIGWIAYLLFGRNRRGPF